MATVWQFLLHPSLGPVNGMLRALGFHEIGFLSEPSYVLPTLVAMGFGYAICELALKRPLVGLRWAWAGFSCPARCQAATAEP